MFVDTWMLREFLKKEISAITFSPLSICHSRCVVVRVTSSKVTFEFRFSNAPFLEIMQTFGLVF